MPDIDRWRTTWNGLGVDTLDERLYAEIIRRYLDPQRHYHTVQHLDECFAKLDEAQGLAEHLHEIELALWFHDAVYEVRNLDNEEQSAAWFVNAASQSGLPGDVTERTRGLILATKHAAQPAVPDAQLLVDVDLAILAAPVDRFDEYERQVREEYSWVPGWLFRRERRKILEGFLARPHVFNTEYFLSSHEARARANLERSIAALGG